jgi:broad specificity phosphatase PhoE
VSKRLILIRHGESEWNVVFNKGFGPSFIVRYASALGRELLMLFGRDSLFLDSPLCDEGMQQGR